MEHRLSELLMDDEGIRQTISDKLEEFLWKCLEELCDFEIKDVFVTSEENLVLQMVMQITAKVFLLDSNHCQQDGDAIFKGYDIRAQVNIDGRLKDFRITGIAKHMYRDFALPYYRNNLLPQFTKENADDLAKVFLETYCPEALEIPMRLDVDKIMHRMGLRKIEHKLSKDGSIFGRIFFENTLVRVYDNNKCSLAYAKAGDVFIDSEANYEGSSYVENNTCVHECVHQWLHRPYAAMERIYDPTSKSIICKTKDVVYNEENSPDWAEWQARILPPRILMYKDTFVEKVTECMDFYEELCNDIIDYIVPMIDELADFYGTSRGSVKIRLIEIGVEAAAGAYAWRGDNNYAKPHRWESGTLDPKQTFTVDEQTAMEAVFSNPELEGIALDYIDGHIVLCDRKYIENDEDGNASLTRYALTHMNECCVPFDISAGCKTVSSSRFLNRSRCADVGLQVVFHNGYEHSPEKQKELKRKINKKAREIAMRLPRKFSECIKVIFKLSDMTEKDVSRETGISEKQIKRICDGQTSSTFKTVAKILLSLQVHWFITEMVFKSEGCNCHPDYDDDEEYELYLALHECYSMKWCDIEEQLSIAHAAI